MSHASDLNDMSLFELFQIETKNQCVNLAQCIVTLFTDSPDQTDFNAIQRAVHSIKGAARIVDLKQVVSLTNSMELVLRHNQTELLRNIKLRHCFEECVEQLNCLTQVTPETINDLIKDKKNIFHRLIQFLFCEL